MIGIIVFKGDRKLWMRDSISKVSGVWRVDAFETSIVSNFAFGELDVHVSFLYDLRKFPFYTYQTSLTKALFEWKIWYSDHKSH